MKRYGLKRATLTAAVLSLLAVQSAQAEIYYTQGASVVRIRISGTLKAAPENGSLDYEEFATGFLVSGDGLVLSAGHIVPQADMFVDGRYTVEAMLLQKQDAAMVVAAPPVPLTLIRATTAAYDVSLFRLANGAALRPVLMCDGATPGQSLRVLGFPSGAPVLEQGPGSVRAPSFRNQPITMSAPINPGDSGAPVFNDGDFVIGIALGGPSDEGARQEGRTLALPIGFALDAVAPELDGLRSTNYAKDCGDIPAARPIARTLAAQSWNASAGTGSAELLAPAGLRFAKVMAESGLARIQDQTNPLPFNKPIIETPVSGGQVTISPDGTRARIQFSGPALSRGPLLGFTVPVDLKPVSQPETGRIQSFHISRLQAIRAPFGPTRRAYQDVFPAPDGFVFEEVVRFTEISRNHVPVLEKPVISSDGRSVIVRYEVESGPLYDQWRGWLDATLGMKLRAAP